MITLDSFEGLLNEKKKVSLTVNSGDYAAEVFLLDSQYKRIDAQTGKTIQFIIDPGVYIVKVRTGSDCQEKSVALYNDQKVDFEPIEFSTPAPIEGTAKTHEYHVGNAIAHSQKVQVKKGEGSQIYIFVRDWTTKTQSAKVKTLKRTPAKGLTLRDEQGKKLVDLEKSSDEEVRWDPWAACNIELEPGFYRLSVTTADGDTLKQTVVASPGWQTQIFLLVRNYGRKKEDKRADLSNSAIFMARLGEGFKTQTHPNNPEDSDFRLAELARQALLNDRQRLSGNLLHQAINRKFTNPMMAIYGAHLLLRDPKYDTGLIRIVIINLRRLLGNSHPDVEALALKAGIKTDFVFRIPPMLRNSWVYVLEASMKQPGLVPAGSPAYKVSGNLLSEGVWLLWRQYSEETNDDTLLIEQLGKLFQLEESGADTFNLAPDQLIQVKKIMPFDSGNADIMSMPHATHFENKESSSEKEKMNNKKILHMVQALGVPRSKIETMLLSFNQDSDVK